MASQTFNPIPTTETITFKCKNVKDEEVELEEIPLLEDENTQGKFFSLSDLLKAEQRRVAKEFELSEYNVFELLTLRSDVKSKIRGIKEKYRFNKIIFYIGKRLENEYGPDTLIFDEMHKAKAGPIPAHLTDDIRELKEKGLVDVYIERDNKKVSQKDKNWEKLMKDKVGSCVVVLTPEGEELAKKITSETSENVLEIIQKTKQDLIYMDTAKLREKVHKEYPEWKKDYTEDDVEDWSSSGIDTCSTTESQ